MNKEQKQRIDNMTRSQLCYMWRFAPVGEPLLQGDTGDYFAKVLKDKGGFSPEISKDIGWNE